MKIHENLMKIRRHNLVAVTKLENPWAGGREFSRCVWLVQ